MTTSSDKRTIVEVCGSGADGFIQKTAFCEAFKEALNSMVECWLNCNNFEVTENQTEMTDKKNISDNKCKDIINGAISVAKNLTNKIKEISNISAGKYGNGNYVSKKKSGSD